MSRLGNALVRAWYAGSPWLWLLRPVEALFRVAAALRRVLYRVGVLGSYRPPVPVVIVGNITVGGTGKTPLVIALVQELQQRGIKVGMVSRGYGMVAAGSPQWVDKHSNASQCGDEALLVHRRTACPCVVSPSRVRAVRLLLARAEVDLVISDDGLQHYALQRDMEIAVLDGARGTGNGFCLPAGPLREPAQRLQEVDFVLWRNGTNPDNAMNYTAVALVNLASGERRAPVSAALSPQVHAVAGLGQPKQFFDMLRQAGFHLQEHGFPDHHRFVAADFSGMSDKPIIMTEKDAVKCTGLAGDDAWYFQISAQLPQALTNAVAALVKH